jgi:superfamily II DNA or RNA helicase
MTLEEWAREAIPATLAPLRRPPPVRLFAHQDLGARRLLAMLARFGGALLFDSVGMGKSFTASAVAREWREEGTIAVAAPAPLLPTWRATLARFGVEGELVAHDGLMNLRPPDGRALLIVDEAHRFRNAATRRYRRLADASCGRALLLVTATPLCNRLGDVATLARLAYADDAFKGYGFPSIDALFESEEPEPIRSFLALASVRREPGSEIRFPSSVRRVVRFSLGDRGADVARRIDALAVPLCGESTGPALLRSHLRARLESSPEALRDSLERQRRFYRRAREKLGEGFVLRRSDFASLFEREERDLFQELLFPEAFLSKADPDASVLRAIERELKAIDAILAACRDVSTEKFDGLDNLCGESGFLPAVVFTRAVATAERVYERARVSLRTGLASSAGAVDARGIRVALDDLVRAFRARALDLLILTDLASEGLDLQAAATVVHFDLPWTAVKLAQRNGRAARIGQARSSVRAVYFVPEEARRETPLRFVARKQRLANRYLEPVAFEGAPLSCGETSVRAASIPAGLAVVEEGALFLLEGQSLDADPRRVRAHPLDLAELRGGGIEWFRWKEAASLIPSRIRSGSPQDRLRSGGIGIARLARRYRAGAERTLADLETLDAEELIEREMAITARTEGESGQSRLSLNPTPRTERRQESG